MNIRRNRAFAFRSQLEVLQRCIAQEIEILKLETEEDLVNLQGAELEAKTDELGPEVDALRALDDALEDLAAERNRYIWEAEFDGDLAEMVVKFKESES